jgi:hypothetical protein
MADSTKVSPPADPNAPPKPKRIVKPRIPDGHTLLKMHIPNEEVAHLQTLANENDRMTPDDMGRSIIRQAIRGDKEKRANRAPSAGAA